ncbi:hypothetical protein [Streptomyces sp. NRRL S-646]|uniref:hypothetical protein n=1 Tax=Streptomyces sp. NRRL S-646 TaxID=1463917 RepID=UPI000569D428|nr:hypothetical protein [Streptomyces sp. NRRL S-646]
MAHTTIKVESSVRDRLAILAAEKGTTIAGLVGEFATHTLTQSERDEQVAKTLEVLHARALRLRPGSRAGPRSGR